MCVKIEIFTSNYSSSKLLFNQWLFDSCSSFFFSFLSRIGIEKCHCMCIGQDIIDIGYSNINQMIVENMWNKS